MKMNKLAFPVILSLVIGIMIVSCTGKTTQKNLHSGVEYYRNLQFSETPFDTEKGTHPLTAAEAKTVNNYKFTYDDSGRLISVEFVRNDVLLGYGSMGGAAKITYEYTADNKQIKRFFNKDNEQIESGGAYTYVYTLDAKGVRSGMMFMGKDGSMVENRNKIHSWVWSILPDGMVRELRYNLAGVETVMNANCPFYELRFSYNEKGYVTRLANYMADTLYNCTAENCGDIGVSYFIFEPNEFGDVLGFSVFNVYGQMSNLSAGWSKRVNKVDENGYLLETVVYDQDNEFVTGNNIPITQNTYDAHGALVEVKNMDKDRNIMNHPQSGVAITEYKYDEAGQRTETLRYDKDHVLVPVTQ
jgi:YD repeat-containing protein